MDRKAWLEWRREGIGSSDAAIIMGVSPWSTPYLLWKDKVFGSPEKEQNSAMKRGTELEPIVRGMLENDTCMLLEPKNVVHALYPWMRSSLDAISLDGRHLFEIKCPGKDDHESARKGIIPAKYIPQCQHQLACTGLQSLNYVSFYGDAYVCVTVERDAHYIEQLIDKEMYFWECVRQKNAPEKTALDYQEKDDDGQWNDLVDQWRDVYTQLKMCEEKEKELRSRIIECSGGQNTIGSGVKLTRQECIGHVDYDKAINEYIISLKQMFGEGNFPLLNIENYRKPSIQKFRLSIF